MAKKNTTTSKSSTTKARKAAGKPAAKSRSKKSPPKRHDHEHDLHGDDEELELDETECKAVDLVLGSEALRNALELEVNTVVTQAVRKICKAAGAALTAAQAENVAMALFGDEVE